MVRPLRSTEAATIQVAIRLTQEEADRWREMAGDQSLAAWIREQCNRAKAKR